MAVLREPTRGKGPGFQVSEKSFISSETSPMYRSTYCCSIVCLAKVAVNATCARGVHDPPVSLFDHIWVGSATACICAAKVHSNDCLPLCVGHIVEGLVLKNAGIVDQYVNSAEAFNHLGNCITILY